MAETSETPKGLFGEHGWFAEPYHKKDLYYTAKEGTVANEAENLRENKKYHEFWAKPYNQGILNSCVANAAAALFHFELKKELAFSQTKTLEVIDPSRRFIWYNAREMEGVKVFDNAMCHTRNAMASLEERGVCDEIDCPYPDLKLFRAPAIQEASKPPEAKAIKAAKDYCIARYERLDKKSSPEDKKKMREMKTLAAKEAKQEEEGKKLKEKLCEAITEGHPVQFGFYYYKKRPHDNFVEVKDNPNAKWSLIALTTKHTKPEAHYGGHAVLAIGYDKDSVLCQNSWGEEKAIFLAPWNWITDFEATEDFWLIKGFRNLNKVSK